MPKFAIKKGDMVEVISGDKSGAKGKVAHVFPKTSKVVVEGVNVVKKAVKPSEKNKDGGFIQKEKPIHISNIKKVEG